MTYTLRELHNAAKPRAERRTLVHDFQVQLSEGHGLPNGHWRKGEEYLSRQYPRTEGRIEVSVLGNELTVTVERFTSR